MNAVLRRGLLPALALVAVLAMFGFGSAVRTAQADVENVDVVIPTFANDDEACDETSIFEDTVSASATLVTYNTPETALALPVNGILALCVSVSSNEPGDAFSADSEDYGRFIEAICNDEDEDGDDFEVNDDQCSGLVGLDNDDIEIACGDNVVDGEGDDENLSLCSDPEIEEPIPGAVEPAEEGDDDPDILLFWQCEDEAGLTQFTLSQTDGDADGIEVHTFWVLCFAQPDEATVTAKPTKVEIVPALGSVAHSEITIVMSGDDMPALFTEIDISVPKCAIEVGTGTPDTTPLTDSIPSDGDYLDNISFPTSGPNADKTVIDGIWFHADYNKCTPGDVVVTVVIEVEGGADLVRTVTINVVGPPAFITATAAPDKLICGEKSTITVTVKDALQQNVSDNTQVELISNWGSVIAGTGATLGFPGTGPVNPLASSAAATYNGVAIAYLLTSNNHVGAYEVVAAAGGTIIATPYSDDPYYDYEKMEVNSFGYRGHSDYVPGAPITTQVTVTCTLPAAPVAPTVTAPVAGTGSITPPNTGDAGLASSSSNAMLFVMVGAAAFVLAGIASVSYARR